MTERKVSILGTEYTIRQGLKSEECDGKAGPYRKSIQICDDKDFLDDDSAPEEKAARKKEVLRHEIVHCFFFESGEEEWSFDEKLVSWFAIQSPKIFKIYQELDIL